MTRYAVDKVLWEVAKNPEIAKVFFTNPDATIKDRELTEQEKSALVSTDLRAIFQLGAHPFLLYSFAIAANGGWSVEFMNTYVEALKGLELGNIET